MHRRDWPFFEKMVRRGATVLVGQAPNSTGVGPALTCVAGHRLANLCGLTTLDYSRTFGRINCLDEYHGRKGSGDAFPIGEARRGADRILDVVGRSDAGGYGHLICLGRNVARAFYMRDDSEWLRWYGCFVRGGDVRPLFVAVAPHPSGLSRWYNDDDNWRRAAEFFARAARESQERIDARAAGGIASTNTPRDRGRKGAAADGI